MFMRTREKLERALFSHLFVSPAVTGQNCSFFDKSIKLGMVTYLYKTNIS